MRFNYKRTLEKYCIFIKSVNKFDKDNLNHHHHPYRLVSFNFHIIETSCSWQTLNISASNHILFKWIISVVIVTYIFFFIIWRKAIFLHNKEITFIARNNHACIKLRWQEEVRNDNIWNILLIRPVTFSKKNTNLLWQAKKENAPYVLRALLEMQLFQ